MTEIPQRLSAALTDRYKIEREIGAGGMATVYLAEDLKHHRKVAVKVLRPDLAAALGLARGRRYNVGTTRLTGLWARPTRGCPCQATSFPYI